MLRWSWGWYVSQRAFKKPQRKFCSDGSKRPTDRIGGPRYETARDSIRQPIALGRNAAAFRFDRLRHRSSIDADAEPIRSQRRLSRQPGAASSSEQSGRSFLRHRSDAGDHRRLPGLRIAQVPVVCQNSADRLHVPRLQCIAECHCKRRIAVVDQVKSAILPPYRIMTRHRSTIHR